MLKRRFFSLPDHFTEEVIDRLMSDLEWRKAWIESGSQIGARYFSDPDLPESHLAGLLEEVVRKRRTAALTD
jgi:hypothetical protein